MKLRAKIGPVVVSIVDDGSVFIGTDACDRQFILTASQADDMTSMLLNGVEEMRRRRIEASASVIGPVD